MWKRLLLWLRPHKNCRGCCMTCSHYDECRGDFQGKEDA